MCTQKQPKAAPVKEKDPQYLRNPWLDGMTMGRSATFGRNALRIDPGQNFRAPTQPLIPPPYQPPGGGPRPPGGGFMGGGDGPGGGGYGGGTVRTAIY